jgi:hypothetical protein
MKAEIKQQWLEALRSGKYMQGQGQLVCMDEDSVTGHCCLGVLADIAGLQPDRFACEGYLGEGGDNSTDLGLGPWENPGDAQFNSDDQATHTTVQRKLAGMNDQGKTFAQIADWIEANIPAESDSTGGI